MESLDQVGRLEQFGKLERRLNRLAGWSDDCGLAGWLGNHG